MSAAALYLVFAGKVQPAKMAGTHDAAVETPVKQKTKERYEEWDIAKGQHPTH